MSASERQERQQKAADAVDTLIVLACEMERKSRDVDAEIDIGLIDRFVKQRQSVINEILKAGRDAMEE